MKKTLKNILKKLKRKIKDRFVSDVYSGNEILLEEFFFQNKTPFSNICGQQASCQINWINNAFSNNPGLQIKAAGYSADYSENWIKVQRLPCCIPVPVGNFTGIGLWLHSNGYSGSFHFSLTNPEGVEYSVSDNNLLNHSGWRKIVFNLNDFKVAPWSRKATSEKLDSCSDYSFSFNLVPDENEKVKKDVITIGKVFLVDSLSPATVTDTIIASHPNNDMLDSFHTARGFSFSKLNHENIEFFLFASSGDDSILNLLPDDKKDVADQCGIRVNSSINSDDHNNNHLSIRSLKFDKPIPYDYFTGVVLTLENISASCGELRFTIGDSDGNTTCVSLYNVFKSKNINRIFITSSRFNFKKFPLKDISSFDFSILPHWNASPVKHEFYLCPPEFITSTEQLREDKTRFIQKEQPPDSSQAVKQISTKLKKWWGLERAAVFIEPTNLCNLRCVMCNHGNFSFKRPIGVMKFENYKKILDEIDQLQANIWEVGPYWLGESFIHPQINQIISYTGNVKKHGQRFINYTLHTNGLLLERKHYDVLLESDLDHLLFSIDAATSDTYRKIRRGGELKKAVERITAFKDYRDSFNRSRPALIVQFIVMDQNVEEIRHFANFWTSRGFKNLIYAGIPSENPFGAEVKTTTDLFPYVTQDSIFIKRLEPNALTKKQQHREILPPDSQSGICRKPCASLWKMLSISWDGGVTACCRDDQTDMQVGNVFEQSLEKIWFGKKLEDLRVSQILGNFDATPKCLNCVNWTKYHLSDDEIRSYLYSIDKEYLFQRYRGR